MIFYHYLMKILKSLSDVRRTTVRRCRSDSIRLNSRITDKARLLRLLRVVFAPWPISRARAGRQRRGKSWRRGARHANVPRAAVGATLLNSIYARSRKRFSSPNAKPPRIDESIVVVVDDSILFGLHRLRFSARLPLPIPPAVERSAVQLPFERRYGGKS